MRKEKTAKEKEEKEAVRVLEQIEAVSINKHMNSLMSNIGSLSIPKMVVRFVMLILLLQKFHVAFKKLHG